MNRGRLALPPVLAALLGSCDFRWEPAFREDAAPGSFESVEIAGRNEALTFARVERDGRRRVLAVTRYAAGAVEGIDLEAALARTVDDPITLLAEIDYDRIADAVAAAPSAARIEAPSADLIQPVDLRDEHIAVGTNFPEHASDAGTVRPFLFPKRVRPTASGAPVTARAGQLLDYEVELAFVTLEPLGARERPGRMGLILCNDFTDRATLMRRLDPRDVESGVGFTTGKSFPGYLPVGDLFVVPRDFRSFASGLQLSLWVDGQLRQRSAAAEMVWKIDEILEQARARDTVRWEHHGERVALPGADGAIPARTLVMSGTPHGTVFSGINIEQKLSGLRTWLTGGWDVAVERQVIEAYIRDAGAAGVYLRPGNDVTIRVDRLGLVRSRVVSGL